MTGPSRPERGQTGSRLLVRLARRLGLSPIPAEAAERLAELEVALVALTQVQTENQRVLGALREAVGRLEKQLVRAGKEQFKANTLTEAQQRSLNTALEQTREADAYRERELAHLRERLAQARGDSRLEVLKSLFPVLDGLEEALDSGDRLLSRQALPGVRREPPRRLPGWRDRLSAALFQPAAERAATEPGAPLSPDAVNAWLAGLRLIRDRLADILAAEGVVPILTQDEVFDPYQHIAVETVPATHDFGPGAITRELRRGYRTEATVLRYAEVAVAREPQEKPDG